MRGTRNACESVDVESKRIRIDQRAREQEIKRAIEQKDMSKVVRVQCGSSGWVDLPAECAALLNQAKDVHLKWCTGEEDETIGKGGDRASSPCVILRGHVLQTSSDLLHVSADGLFAQLPFHAGEALPSPGDAIRVHVLPVAPSTASEDENSGHQNRRLRRRV